MSTARRGFEVCQIPRTRACCNRGHDLRGIGAAFAAHRVSAGLRAVRAAAGHDLDSSGRCLDDRLDNPFVFFVRQGRFAGHDRNTGCAGFHLKVDLGRNAG